MNGEAGAIEYQRNDTPGRAQDQRYSTALMMRLQRTAAGPEVNGDGSVAYRSHTLQIPAVPSSMHDSHPSEAANC